METTFAPELLQVFADRAADPFWVGSWQIVALLGTANFFAIALPLLFSFAPSRLALRLGAGFALAASLAEFLKDAFQRPRPDLSAFGLLLPLEDAGVFENAAFPSGHVLMALVLWGLVAVHAPTRWRMATRAVCAGLILAIATSRLALLRHDLLDVLGGVFFGGALLLVLVQFEKHLVPSWSSLPRVERVGLWFLAAICLQATIQLPITALVLGVGAGLGVGALGFAGWRRRTDRPRNFQVALRAVFGVVGVALVRALVPMDPQQSAAVLFAAYFLGGLWIAGALPALSGGIRESADQN